MSNLHERIAKRAYEIWEFRMANNMSFRVEGCEIFDITPQDDWLEAEQEILHADSFPQRFSQLGRRD